MSYRNTLGMLRILSTEKVASETLASRMRDKQRKRRKNGVIAHKTALQGIVGERVLARTRIRSVIVRTVRWADERRGIRLANTHCENQFKKLLIIL